MNGDLTGGRTLDLGCGTGRLGPVLRGVASRLVGVDLSEGMLARARRRGHYDALVQAEATAYLSARPGAFDRIAAAGLPAFFGPPEALLAALAFALVPGGRLILVGDALDPAEEDGAGNKGAPAWRLNPDGRYAHRLPALLGALADSGFTVEASDTGPLRRERATPITGFVILARRSPA